MFTDHFFKVSDDVTIHYYDEGVGRPVIFVPGWTFSADVFEKQIHYFQSNYRIIAVDPRSQGKSTVTRTGNDHKTHSQDIVALINHLGLDKPVLVGWSFGALETWGVIMEIGTENIGGLFNIDMSPEPVNPEPGMWVEDTIDNIKQTVLMLRTQAGYREVLEGYTKEVMIQRELTDDELAWILGCSTTPFDIAALQYVFGCFENYKEQAAKADAELPTEFVIAEHWADVAVPYMQKLCPSTKLHVFGGHMMFWEHSEKFNGILDKFLAEALNSKG